MTLRLIRAYRGYAAGEQIDVPPRLGEQLVRSGVASIVVEATFPQFSEPAERAVATEPRKETR